MGVVGSIAAFIWERRRRKQNNPQIGGPHDEDIDRFWNADSYNDSRLRFGPACRRA
jgi:hypothetical protein